MSPIPSRVEFPSILRREQKGFVLLSVLLVTTIVSALALGVAVGTKAYLRRMDTELAILTARSLADAGLTRAIAALEAANDPLLEDLRVSPVSWSYAGARILLSLESEAGKLDLNTGEAAFVEAVMRAFVKKQPRAAGILERWTKLRRRGHEIEAVNLLLDPRERFTDVANELEKHFTTASGAKGVDPLAASDLILRHVPGVTEADLSQIDQQRQGSRRDQDLSAVKQRYQPLLDGERALYRIHATLRPNDQLTVRREVLLAQDSETGAISIIFWRDRLERGGPATH